MVNNEAENNNLFVLGCFVKLFLIDIIHTSNIILLNELMVKTNNDMYFPKKEENLQKIITFVTILDIERLSFIDHPNNSCG